MFKKSEDKPKTETRRTIVEDADRTDLEQRAPQRASEEAQLDYAPLVRLMRAFMAAIPTTGAYYEAVEGDRFSALSADVPDGGYRLQGTEWLFTIERGKLVDARRIGPPDFGGSDVIQIPAPV